MNVVFVSESGNLLLVYGKVDNIVYFDKKLAGRLLGLPPVAMTTTVVYHTFAMQRGRPLKFVLYHKVVLGVKKQHFGVRLQVHKTECASKTKWAFTRI